MNVTKHVHATIKLDEHETVLLQDLLSLLAEKMSHWNVTLGVASGNFLSDLRDSLSEGIQR